MGKAAKVHLLGNRSKENEAIAVSACGFIAHECSEDAREVTCKLCLKQMAKDAGAYIPTVWRSPNKTNFVPGAMWTTWREAFEIRMIYVDDGFPMKSTSDPGRFGSHHSGHGSAEGDRAQSIAGDLAIVARLFEEVFEHDFQLESGDVISGYTAGKIFEYRIAGRPLDFDGKKLPRRVEWTARDLADYVNGLGVITLSVGDIAAIVSLGVRHIEEGLHRRGLVRYLEAQRRIDADEKNN